MKTEVLGKIALSSITGTSLSLTFAEVSELHGYIENLRAIVRDARPLLVRLGDFIGNDENRCAVVLAATKALNEGA